MIDSLYFLQFACFIFMLINALILGITHLHMKWTNRRYEWSRWLILAGMMGLAIQYLLQMHLGFRAKSDDLGAIFNILVYTPCITTIAMGIYNIEATHANRRKMNIVCACIYAAIIAVFCIGYSNSGSLNIGNWLYAMLVLFGTNVAYCIYMIMIEMRKRKKMLELMTGNDMLPYVRYARVSVFSLFFSALVMPSGFYPVDGGEILIGGKNIQSYSEKALIQNIAFVFQRSQLLKTSIYENVRIGNPQATRQQIMDALDAANCTSILDKFPQREMTVIGAKGVYLSGGEVQRIAIARAILKNANIVIMDEASAAADPENEYELQQAFQKLMRGKTVIMIAHRLSSIQNVDQILFVQNGKVVEQGTHNELMACNGRYKDFQDVYCKANQWRLA